ncbi:MAG: replication-associated recombination protein A [Pseudomonadales bacterium]
MTDLFTPEKNPYQPLAAKVRPRALDDFYGQEHIAGEGSTLRMALEAGQPHSMILWGPPGVGKTTLARMVSECADTEFITLSAVTSGIKDVRDAIDRARQVASMSNRKTVLFVDEVHRFNKAQQDGFLPHIEDGTIIFIGATTENPGFELNSALLSRCKLYVLKSLSLDALRQIIVRARAQSYPQLQLEDEQLDLLAEAADGDGRRALNMLEIAAAYAGTSGRLNEEQMAQVLSGRNRRFDKGGDHFYDQISALHKSVRGSNPDAAMYWFGRMIDGGCDPLYIARRVVRMATEDIGNADPRALEICLNAWETYDRLGSPEGELAIAQAISYLACAPKSNAVYKAFNQIMADISSDPSYEVPEHLRNAPTKVAKDLGHGENYRYAHDEEGAYAAGEVYLPREIAERHYYRPVNQGLESKIAEKLEFLRQLDKKAQAGK